MGDLELQNSECFKQSQCCWKFIVVVPLVQDHCRWIKSHSDAMSSFSYPEPPEMAIGTICPEVPRKRERGGATKNVNGGMIRIGPRGF